MNLGFTGTQYERYVTWDRQQELRRLLKTFYDRGFRHFHHGDCIGADEVAARIAREEDYIIVGHPPTIVTKRAYVKSDIWFEPMPYLKRNRVIVDVSAALLALPKKVNVEEQRSGTWSTIRYAHKQGKPVVQV